MEKVTALSKTEETLRPFETQNLISTIQTMTFEQFFSNWILVALTAIVLFLGIYKKSKTVLLTVFFLFGLMLMIRYALPPPGEELSLKSIIPFIGFGLSIGGIIVYFSCVKD